MIPRLNLGPSSSSSVGAIGGGLGGAINPGTGWGTTPFVGPKPGASSRMNLGPKNPFGFASWNEYYLNLQNTPWSSRQVEYINYIERVLRGIGYGAPGGGNMGPAGWGGVVTSGPHLGELISAGGAALTSFLPGQTISFGIVEFQLPYSENAGVPIGSPWGRLKVPFQSNSRWAPGGGVGGPNTTESIIARQRANRGRSRPWGGAYGSLSSANPGNFTGRVPRGSSSASRAGARSVTSGGVPGYQRMSLVHGVVAVQGSTGYGSGPEVGGFGSSSGVGYGSGSGVGEGSGPSISSSGEVGTSGGTGPVSEGAGPVGEGGPSL